MVLVTKYPHPVLSGAVRDLVYETIQSIFEERGLNILEMNGEEDHVAHSPTPISEIWTWYSALTDRIILHDGSFVG